MVLNQTNFTQHECLTDMTRFEVMITTCLWHRWFCNCGIVLCLQLPGHIGAKHIYLKHFPRRRVTVLRSCYIMFQASTCMHCTATVRCSTDLIRELGRRLGKRGWFFWFWMYCWISWGLSRGSSKKKKTKKLVRLTILNPGWIADAYQNTCVAFKNSGTLASTSSIKTESSGMESAKMFLKSFKGNCNVEMHCITKYI